MKPTIFVVATGNQDYFTYTLPFIKHYADTHGYKLHIQMITPGVPSSWLKIVPHRFVDAEFILSLDADIIPLPGAMALEEEFDFTSLNMAIDMMIYKKGKRYNENFWYNAGLIGIPSYLFQDLDKVYESHPNKEILCWEQFPLNDLIATRRLPVKVLKDRWNYMIRFDEVAAKPESFVDFKHITSGRDKKQRTVWAKMHYEYYQDVVGARWRSGPPLHMA